MQTHDAPSRDSATARAILTASAFILGGMILLKAGDLPANEAHAGVASAAHGYTVVTATNGVGRETRPNELLYVIDDRNEILYIYEVEDAATRRITLRGGGPLPGLFRTGRGR